MIDKESVTARTLSATVDWASLCDFNLKIIASPLLPRRFSKATASFGMFHEFSKGSQGAIWGANTTGGKIEEKTKIDKRNKVSGKMAEAKTLGRNGSEKSRRKHESILV